MKTRLLGCLAVVIMVCAVITVQPGKVSAGPQDNAGSQLQIIGKDGKPAGFVPLKHTAVKTEISGFVARIAVTQEFENVLPNAVEAIYVFPLPQDSAVDGMVMKVGDREIQAVIKEREEARQIFEAARNAGHTAALLDQERPNIFTQSVTNIPPNGKVEITLSVIELLKYEAGTYSFVFPTVVGPRYIPGNPAGSTGQVKDPPSTEGGNLQDVSLRSGQDRGTMPDTDQVPDASKISPPVAGFHTPDAHAGHDFSIEVNLAAGVPVGDVESTSHKIFADRTGADSYRVRLADDAVLPNKDFILKYKVAGPGISDAILTHADKAGGYFTLILQPPDSVPDNRVVPREIIFVLDTSGSMWGFPLDMAKKTIARALDNLRPEETFNLITFSGDTKILFPGPVSPTKENIAAAKHVLAGAYGSGGTEMMKAIRTALGDDVEPDKQSSATQPLRVVVFMTDGYVGNDAEIVAEVKKHPESRVFAFGIGTAVNRFLLSKMSEEGHGEVEYVTDPKEAQPAADRLYERVHSPLLTNISIDWKGLPVAEIYPAEIPDLFAAKPIVITGRYTEGAKGAIEIRGIQAGGEFHRKVAVEFPVDNAGNAVLEKIWARRKVDDLMSQDWLGVQQGQSKYKAQIVEVGLKHSLATQYTSFVAVEEKTVIQDGKPVRIEVPVELPEHVSPLAVPGRAQAIGGFVTKSGTNSFYSMNAPPSPTSAPSSYSSYGAGAASQTVEVTAETPKIETSTAQVTHTFDEKDLRGPVNTNGTGIVDALKQRADKKKAQARLSAELRSLYDCSQKKAVASGAAKCTLPQSGKVEVEVQLSNATPDITIALKQAGLTIKSGEGTTTVRGEIEVANLERLAVIDAVKSVSKARDHLSVVLPPS
jgi:Ca-activated chloride channel homolog